MAKSQSAVADTGPAKDAPKTTRRRKSASASESAPAAGKAESKPEPKSQPKPDSKPEQKPEPKSEQKPEQKPESRPESRPSGNGGGSTGGEQRASSSAPQPAQSQPQQYQQSPPSQMGQMSQMGQPGQPGSSRKRRKNKRGKQRLAQPTGAVRTYAVTDGSVPTDDDIAREAEAIRAARRAGAGEDAVIPLLLSELRAMSLEQLHTLAEESGLEDFHQLHKSELVYRISKARAGEGLLLIGEGTLEILPEGFGFLRSPEASYLSGPDDVYVSQSIIRRLKLRKGMVARGPVLAPRDGQKFFALVDVDSVNGHDPSKVANLAMFEDLTPLHPEERLVLETEPGEIEMRIVDLVAPIGKGQRGLIVAPPRTGKTVLLQKMTRAICRNFPGVHVIVLLIDERPEEVTDFRRHTPEQVEVVASTFDERSSRHVQVADMVIEKAKRMVEFGDDVVILLDSITRLARAYNNEMPHSGKIMTGGIDSGALQRPKKFFGAARAIEHGGSLTILATALVDTGSKADEVIFEEFKGTGNSELHLDRKLVEKRIWPAIDISASGTRREELLLDPKELELVYRLRKVLSDMNVVEAMELLKGRLGKAKTNAEFLVTMNLG